MREGRGGAEEGRGGDGMGRGEERIDGSMDGWMGIDG